MSSYQLNAQFFRRAKRVRHAVELTETQAIIPASKSGPEIRVSLPNYRLRTVEERQAALELRYDQIKALEEQIEVERKALFAFVATFRDLGTGLSDIFDKNQQIQTLMDSRARLAHPQVWIDTLEGVSLKDIFETARDLGNVPGGVRQLKKRVEPIETLYVTVGEAKREAEFAEQESKEAEADEVMAKEAGRAAAATSRALAASVGPTAPKAEDAAKQGAIIAKAKKSFKLKASAPQSVGGAGPG
jgi:hypothetical protein